jgi:histidyl-tRNA synthetase
LQAGNLKKKFKQASEINAIFTIIVEDDNSLTIKNMDLGTQEKLLYNGYLSQEIIKKIIPNL